MDSLRAVLFLSAGICTEVPDWGLNLICCLQNRLGRHAVYDEQLKHVGNWKPASEQIHPINQQKAERLGFELACFP